VLFALLPPAKGLSFASYLGVFLLAQTAGLISQVPGGLGVFETMILLLLSHTLPASLIFGALLAYRGIYYILPLLLAVILLGIQEIIQRKKRLQRAAQIFGRLGAGVVPNIMAFASFLSGAVLLFSGATPALGSRLAHLRNFLPLPVLELSHFLGSLVGTGLLFLARGLQRRLDAAYILTAALLGFGIIFSLLKGLDYEEALILAITLGTLMTCRRNFHRKSSLLSEPFGAGWMGAIVMVLVCSLWLGMFSYKHVEYSKELWWRFTLEGNAPRFLRGMVAAVAVLFFYFVVRLLRPSPGKPAVPQKEELQPLVDVVQHSRQTYANLALLGDKAFLFSAKQNAFIMYNIEGRSWVVMGDPVGPGEEWAELVWRFRELCDRYDGWPVFYEVGPETLYLYLDLGLTLLKLGEEGRVMLETFTLKGGGRKGLRNTFNKLGKEGFVFEVIPREGIPYLLPVLKNISDTWLGAKSTREKRFSLGSFNLDYLKHFPVAVVRKQDKIMAFANIWCSAEKQEASIDLMRHLPDAPQGIMEFLFIHLILWGKDEGYRWFNLGMAPLSGLADYPLAPIWNRLGAFLFRHGEHFYNFQGLRQFKEKFSPRWEPKYLASPGGLALPRIFANIASLISGGLKGVIAK